MQIRYFGWIHEVNQIEAKHKESIRRDEKETTNILNVIHTEKTNPSFLYENYFSAFNDSDDFFLVTFQPYRLWKLCIREEKGDSSTVNVDDPLPPIIDLENHPTLNIGCTNNDKDEKNVRETRKLNFEWKQMSSKYAPQRCATLSEISQSFVSRLDLNTTKPKIQKPQSNHIKGVQKIAISVEKDVLFKEIESEIQHFNEERPAELLREVGDANLRGQKIQRNYFKVPNKNFLFPSVFLLEQAGIPWITISKNLYLLSRQVPVLVISLHEDKQMVICTAEESSNSNEDAPNVRLPRSTKSTTSLENIKRTKKKKKKKHEERKGAFGIVNPHQKSSLHSIFSQEIAPSSFGHLSLPSLSKHENYNNNNRDVNNNVINNDQPIILQSHSNNNNNNENSYLQAKRFSCNILYEQRVYIIGGCKYSSSPSSPDPTFEFQYDEFDNHEDVKIVLSYFDYVQNLWQSEAFLIVSPSHDSIDFNQGIYPPCILFQLLSTIIFHTAHLIDHEVYIIGGQFITQDISTPMIHTVNATIPVIINLKSKEIYQKLSSSPRQSSLNDTKCKHSTPNYLYFHQSQKIGSRIMVWGGFSSEDHQSTTFMSPYSLFVFDVGLQRWFEAEIKLNHNNNNQSISDETSSFKNAQKTSYYRFGHSSILYKNRYFVIVGGVNAFGVPCSPHHFLYIDLSLLSFPFYPFHSFHAIGEVGVQLFTSPISSSFADVIIHHEWDDPTAERNLRLHQLMLHSHPFFISFKSSLWRNVSVSHSPTLPTTITIHPYSTMLESLSCEEMMLPSDIYDCSLDDSFAIFEFLYTLDIHSFIQYYKRIGDANDGKDVVSLRKFRLVSMLSRFHLLPYFKDVRENCDRVIDGDVYDEEGDLFEFVVTKGSHRSLILCSFNNEYMLEEMLPNGDIEVINLHSAKIERLNLYRFLNHFECLANRILCPMISGGERHIIIETYTTSSSSFTFSSPPCFKIYRPHTQISRIIYLLEEFVMINYHSLFPLSSFLSLYLPTQKLNELSSHPPCNYDDDRGSDEEIVTFQFKSGRKLKAHKLILIVNSSYFARLFSSSFTDAKSRNFNFEHFNFFTILQIITFIYSKTISFSPFYSSFPSFNENQQEELNEGPRANDDECFDIMDLIRTADLLEMSDLVNLCLKFLIHYLQKSDLLNCDRENALMNELQEFSNLYQSISFDPLRSFVANYFVDHPSKQPYLDNK